MMKARHTVLMAAVSGVLTACASGAGPSDGQAATPQFDGVTQGANPSFPIGEVPAELRDQILAEAAERAAVAPSDLEIAVAESVTWSDGSMGCPEPGMMYTQALVPGYRVVVEAGGDELHFHASESGDYLFCEDPQPPLDHNPNE